MLRLVVGVLRLVVGCGLGRLVSARAASNADASNADAGRFVSVKPLKEVLEMNKKELLVTIAERSGLTQSSAAAFMKAFCDIICEQVSTGGEVNVTGYMKFSQVERKARTARNPRTGEPVAVPATKAVKIQAGSKLKAAAKGSGAVV